MNEGGLRPKLRVLLRLFVTFVKIGPITFGGGYAMIPMFEREVVERRGWVRQSEMPDLFAVAQSVPGAIAINSATIIGYRIAGIAGAVTAAVAILLPTFLIVLALSLLFLKVQHDPRVEAAFVAMRATIVALITFAAWKIGKQSIVDKSTLIFMGVSVALLYWTGLHPILIIAAGAVGGIAVIALKRKIGRGNVPDGKGRETHKYEDYFIGDGI